MRVLLTRLARADLVEIGDYIAVSNRIVADRFVSGLEQNCRGIGQNPMLYPLLPGREETGVRRRVSGSYLIFYRIRNNSVQILRILHGARDIDAILFGED